ncbi:MAG TPA: hypothetical protein VJN64_17455 [Terriglobales bacterium]|nr:hypothetical protein [Terriglobales bacterium]
MRLHPSLTFWHDVSERCGSYHTGQYPIAVVLAVNCLGGFDIALAQSSFQAVVVSNIGQNARLLVVRRDASNSFQQLP